MTGEGRMRTRRSERPTVAGAMLAVAALLGACSAGGGVTIPPLPIASRDAVPVSATIHQPEGPGPFPAIVLLHGCSGNMFARQPMWADRLVGWGYVVAVVDSFGPRGVGEICTSEAWNPTRVPPTARALDAQATATWLRSQSFVRADRIAVIGFSHGGMTALYTATPLRVAPNLPRFAAVVAYYPYCEYTDFRDLDTPTLILIGDADQWTPAERCSVMKT